MKVADPKVSVVWAAIVSPSWNQYVTLVTEEPPSKVTPPAVSGTVNTTIPGFGPSEGSKVTFETLATPPLNVYAPVVVVPYTPEVHVVAVQLPAPSPERDGNEGGVRLASGFGTL
jgi:hypothetical protein